MRQPVSRIAFDRRRGFLGVHLQEGAPFIDAAWNEGADITWGLLRDAIIAGDIEGTSGRELRIAPVIKDPEASQPLVVDGAADGPRERLRNLMVCGTSADGSVPPHPFYCYGLPVLWNKDIAIDQQGIRRDFRSDVSDAAIPTGGTWLDLLEDHVPYEIFLRARVETFDGLDDPFLDDPGLGAVRGTFRKRVSSEVRIRKLGAPRSRGATNVRLSVDGSYLSDQNVLYRVELDSSTGTSAFPAASVLWDPDAAATVARVVSTSAEGARDVQVDTTEGFASGFVRFEGPEIGPALYRVTQAPDQESTAIRVTRHRCDRRELSLVGWQQIGPCEGVPADRFRATFVVPARVQKGDLLSDLPRELELAWDAAKVAAEPRRGPDPDVVELTLERAAPGDAGSRALSTGDWRPLHPARSASDGTVSAQFVLSPPIQSGDIVTALPPPLGTPDTGPWVVSAVTPDPVAGGPVTIAFGPAGLAQPLRTLDRERRVVLRKPAHPFDPSVEVDDRSDWEVGMRVRIQRADDPDGTSSELAETRTVVRIEQARRARQAGQLVQDASRPLEPGEWRRPGDTRPYTMIVRFDQSLSHDHAADVTEVVPENLIRVRRFAGHDCRLDIDRIDPPHQGVASISGFTVGKELGGGLSLHLTIEKSDGEVEIERGHGWHFAARGDGFVETRMFAGVEDEPACEVPLAQLIVTPEHYELTDLRPLPAAAALHDELARIEAAAVTMAEQLEDAALTQLLGEIAALARHPRVQRRLVQRLHELAGTRHPKLHASPLCKPWLERLRLALDGAPGWASSPPVTEPMRRQVATIAFALGGLAYAASIEHPPLTRSAADKPDQPEPPAPPAEAKS